MRRPPAYVGRVQTEAAEDPAVVARRAGQMAPLVSTATQVAPPVDPDEPLFRDRPRDGEPDGARGTPPPVAHPGQPTQQANKASPSPGVTAKVSGRQAKALVATVGNSRKAVMKEAQVRSAKVAKVAPRTAGKHRHGKQPYKQANKRVAATKTRATTSRQASAARQKPSAQKQPRRAATTRKEPQARRLAAAKAG